MLHHFIPYTLKENRNVILTSLCSFTFIGLMCLCSNANSMQILKIYEMFLLPHSACWAIYSLLDYIEPNIREVFLSYPKSRLSMGFGKATYMSFIFIILFGILFFLSFPHMQESFLYFSALCIEIIFWSYLGFFLIVTSQNVILSMSLIWIYTAIQILDIEKYFETLSIYMYNCDSMNSIMSKISVLLLLGFTFAFRGHKKFSKMTVN